MKKRTYILAILIFILTIGAKGCISFKAKEEVPPPADGGFYALGKDKDNNYIWGHKVYLATTSSQKPDFKTADVTVMVKDPQDDRAIYLGTKSNGLYFTYDAGRNWFQSPKLANMEINAIGVSSKNKCLIYVAAGSDLYKSEDCSRSWTKMYNDTRDGFYISALAIDSYNEGVVYLGLSAKTKTKKDNRQSDIIKSGDFAKSWRTVSRLPSGSIINKILINPKDTRIVYVATDAYGIIKTTDAGEMWQDITGKSQEIPKKGSEFTDQRWEKLVDFTTDVRAKGTRDSLVFRDLVMIPDENDSLIHASNYGLLRSRDGGATWKEIKLIPATGEEKAIIYSLAINPKDGSEFYYGTNDTLFITTDGGENWTTIKGPSTRAINQIIVTPNEKEERNIYVGVYNLKPPSKK